MTIYDNKGVVLHELTVDDNSYRYSELCGDHYVRLQFSSFEYIDIPVGSYVVFNGLRYTLLDPQNVKVNNRTNYEYVAIFDAEHKKLGQWLFKNTVDGRLKFTLTAKPHEHLQMLIDNLSMRDSAWTMGECVKGDEITISYNYISCLDALRLMAEKLKTEWEVVANTVHLRKVEYNYWSPLSLAYGKGNGFVSGVGRTNYSDTKSLALVYPQGSERNIDASKYGSATLLLPKGQSIKYDGYHFEDELGYTSKRGIEYVSSLDGTAVGRLVPTANTTEGTIDCTEIYPQRKGEVTSVVVANEQKNLYDIVDNSIPSSLNYNDYAIAGEKMIIKFESGMLAGREFDVSKYAHDAIGFSPARRFEIEPQAYDGVMMPGGEFVPAVGDKYAIFGIALPDAYICNNATKSGASWDMMRKAIKFLAENEKPQYTFTGKLDGIWAKKNWSNVGSRLRVGECISFTDAETQPEAVRVRIVNVKEFINNPYAPEISLEDKALRTTYTLSTLVKISDSTTKEYETRIENALGSTRVTVIKEDLTKATNDRQLYINEELTLKTDVDALDKSYGDFVSRYEELRDVNGELLIDANGQALRVRVPSDEYTHFKVAAKAYENELKAVILSHGIVEPNEAFVAARTNYYKVRAELQKSISTGTKESVEAVGQGVDDLDYLRQTFGEDNVADSNGVTLSRMMSVKDENNNVVAGLYGGGVESLNSEFEDDRHGTLMFFAGAESVQKANEANHRVYEDGSVYTKTGIFEGVVKHRMVDITLPRLSDILSNTGELIDGNNTYIITPDMMSAIMNFTNKNVPDIFQFTSSDHIAFIMPVLYNNTLYGANGITTKDELRGLIGTRFIIYNNTPAFIHFCGRRYWPNPAQGEAEFSNTDVCYDDWIIWEDRMAIAECKIDFDNRGAEVVYWDIRIGRQYRYDLS